MSRVLITGLAGFTGRYLADCLLARGHSIYGLSHKDAGDGVAGVENHVCDLSDADGVASLMAHVQPEKVVHLAAIAFVAHGDIDAMYRTNIVGTRHLLEALASMPVKPQSVVVASSANVYGNQVSGAIDETVLPAPVNDYAVTKLAMEYVVRLYADRLPITLCRPFNYTGVGQDTNFLIAKIVDHVRRRAPMIELGNLDVARDFSDVRDVVQDYAALLDAESGAGDVFNICSGQAHSLKDVLDYAMDISGHRLEVRVNPAFVRQSDVKTLSGNRAKLDGVIGTRQRHRLSDTIAWMLNS